MKNSKKIRQAATTLRHIQRMDIHGVYKLPKFDADLIKATLKMLNKKQQ